MCLFFIPEVMTKLAIWKVVMTRCLLSIRFITVVCFFDERDFDSYMFVHPLCHEPNSISALITVLKVKESTN